MKWNNWKSKLYVFEEWRKERQTRSTICGWLYLLDVFLDEVASLSTAGVCLDVGCGCGHYLCKITEERKHEGIGLDPMRESLNGFKQAIKARKIEKIELVRGVGEYLPIKKESVQLCITTQTLDHTNEPNQVVEEIHRVLGPNGYFILLQSVARKKNVSSSDETHLREFTMMDLKRLLKPFRIKKIKQFSCLSSKLPVPNKLLESSSVYKLLSRIYGVIGRYSNFSEAIMKSRKNEEKPLL